MTRRIRLVVLVVGIVAFAAAMSLAFTGMPHFGGDIHAYRDAAVSGTYAHDTANVVSSINFDQRGFDTFGEETILFCTVVGVAALLRPVHRERRREVSDAGLVLESTGLLVYVLFPLTIVLGVNVVAHGAVTPGGGFQGGVILSTGIHLLYVGGRYSLLRKLRPLVWFQQGEALGVVLFGALGIAGAALGSALFANVIPQGQLSDFISSGTVPLFNIAVGMTVCSSVIVLLASFLDQTLAIRADAGNDSVRKPRSGFEEGSAS
ncbi:MnhB domain-containing protein [Arthrobacter bambusae]|uniref:MnhB domain-containing protein n=1 Tax=Arthrobacter bambusae TaxID=1338426 RepID=UPI002781F46F|nr:MnhB domain-containing protein [Arthrobacter bambusae]MDQ0028424.1 multicomponent Na+:H+ antiporter subunit B [Arthrobacter bambusae]MDQ0096781.1 multicomponent Na+:H+ antiporter subunit B [Arthrobacter bambusae]